MNNWIEIGLFSLTMLVLSYFLAYTLSTLDILWTRLESGSIKFIKTGNSLRKIIYNTPGFELVNGDNGIEEFKTTTKTRPRPWLGLYWIGLPPYATIHRFKITKETENPSGKTPEDWILGGKEEFAVDSLRFIFPRPYVLKAVELKDKTSVDLLVLAKFETVRPYVPVFYFKGKFFETAGADIRANIIDITKDLDLESFIAAPKGEVDGILSGMKDRDGKFNQTLIEQVGLRLTGISIPQYDPSDEKLRDAMNATTIAKEQGKAKVVTANAEAEAQERLATAQRIEIKETVEGFGGDTKAAAEVLRAQALAGGSITTLVDGKAPAVVPVGGGKS